MFGALGHCPRDKLLGIHLPRINFALKKLDETTPEAWEGGHYWDGTYNQVGDNQCSLADYCLGHFLRGYIQASARYQVRSTILDYYTSAPSLFSRLHSGAHGHALTSQPTCASESALKPVPGQPSDDEIDRAAEKDYEACLRHSPDVEVSEDMLGMVGISLSSARPLYPVSLPLRVGQAVCATGRQSEREEEL